MESGNYKEHPYQVRSHFFPGNLERGALAHTFMTIDNQDEGENNYSNIIPFPLQAPSEPSDDPNAIKQEHLVDGKPSPAEALSNLVLPEKMFSEFTALLGRLGYHCMPDTIVTIYGKRDYTRVHRNSAPGEWRYLIFIPDWIITVFNSDNETAITALSAAFPRDAYVLVFYKSSRSPHRRLQNIIEDGWDKYKKSKIISWEQVQDLIDEDKDMQKFMVAHMLGFDTT